MGRLPPGVGGGDRRSPGPGLRSRSPCSERRGPSRGRPARGAPTAPTVRDLRRRRRPLRRRARSRRTGRASGTRRLRRSPQTSRSFGQARRPGRIRWLLRPACWLQHGDAGRTRGRDARTCGTTARGRRPFAARTKRPSSSRTTVTWLRCATPPPTVHRWSSSSVGTPNGGSGMSMTSRIRHRWGQVPRDWGSEGQTPSSPAKSASSRRDFTADRKRAASAPSIVRWSYDSAR